MQQFPPGNPVIHLANFVILQQSQTLFRDWTAQNGLCLFIFGCKCETRLVFNQTTLHHFAISSSLNGKKKIFYIRNGLHPVKAVA
jgi:hypothetical protein